MNKAPRGARAPIGTSLWGAPTTKPRTCKRCGGRIYWQLTRNKRYMPVDPDGRPHSRDCAKSKRRK